MTSQLPRRAPGATLAAIVPEDTGPADANLFGAPVGESLERRFDPARLHRVIQVSPSPESAA